MIRENESSSSNIPTTTQLPVSQQTPTSPPKEVQSQNTLFATVQHVQPNPLSNEACTDNSAIFNTSTQSSDRTLVAISQNTSASNYMTIPSTVSSTSPQVAKNVGFLQSTVENRPTLAHLEQQQQHASGFSSLQVSETRSELLIACSNPIHLHSYTAPAISTSPMPRQGQHPQLVEHQRDSSDFSSKTGGFNSVAIYNLQPKRIKLDDAIASSSEEIAKMRKTICDQRQKNLCAIKEKYVDEMSELFFLQNSGNMMDYLTWRKKPTSQLILFLKSNSLDADAAEVEMATAKAQQPPYRHTLQTSKPPLATPTATLASNSSESKDVPNQSAITSHQKAVNVLRNILVTTAKSNEAQQTSSKSPVQTLTVNTASSITRLPTMVSRGSASSPTTSNVLTAETKSSLPALHVVAGNVGTSISKTSNALPLTSSMVMPATPKPHRVPLTSMSPARLQTRQHSISAVYDSTIGSQEEIVERAKQEAFVVQRIAELRKEGLWSEKRLPKVQEPPRTKAHWDYLLEEMVWLATDFAQERKWKKAAAKKCARMCQKYHQEQKLREERAEKEAEQKLKRIASTIAKEIKQFWTSVEKLVEYKQQSRLEEKRKKALDLHLNFIVDQTEKYSSWLAQGMNKSLLESSNTSMVSSTRESRASSPIKSSSEDDDFKPESEETDDEETIAIEEQDLNSADEDSEIKLLQQESEVPIEELLNSLPQEILESAATPLSSDNEEAESEISESANKDQDVDVEFHANSDESDDDEATLDEQEQRDKDVDHKKELDDLQKESEMSLEELAEKYAGAYAEDYESTYDSEECDDEDSGEDCEDDGNEESEEHMEEIGLESLVSMQSSETDTSRKPSSDNGPGKEITDIAADAESFQPKGYTYSTAQVATTVPFLLKHQLREYQHIGLDWLVTMQERKLNGILADEMGLGKTIQTIALLAHLACEKGIWGPHLIVVPTSVMLNWEMEFKKWCPAFKILTYYGTQKERKQKRQGWTKPNAFHICITSYKLVIQDHQSFRRKRWKHFILDEAQNIKNFKSQRWQLLLNFQSQWRLLLTGTPLQNSLMELWSLMHFLMPNVFQSHRDFKEWFSNPLSGMIEGSHEYNESLVKRLHKVLRPFLLRRLKSEVEKQLPGKYEHVIMCRLSKRQRFLYDDFMSQTKTRETLATGNFMSVINVLMQLRKVCNHPNMFEGRPIISPLQVEGIQFWTSSLAYSALDYDPMKHVDLYSLNLLLADLELHLTAFAAHRTKRFQTPKKLIEEIDFAPDLPPKCPPGKIKLHVRTSTTSSQNQTDRSTSATTQARVLSPASARTNVASVVPSSTVTYVAGAQVKPILNSPQQNANVTAVSTIANQTKKPVPGYTFQLVPQQPQGLSSSVAASLTPTQVVTSAPITVQIQQTQQGPRILSVPAGQISAQFSAGFAQIVQTSTGQHILLTSNPQAILHSVNSTATSAVTATQGTSSSTVPAHSAGVTVTTTTTTSATKPQPIITLNTSANKIGSKPSLLTVSTTVSSVTTTNKIVTLSPNKPVTRADTRHDETQELVLAKHSATKSLFHLASLTEKRKQARKDKLQLLAKFNTRRCEACPIYGSDLVKALTVVNHVIPRHECNSWGGMGYVHCLNAVKPCNKPNFYWNQTDALCDAVWTPEKCLNQLRDVTDRFVFCVPPVMAPRILLHVSHPPPSRFQHSRHVERMLQSVLSKKDSILHCISSAMATQFPDPRLIQYDCGKLQTLDHLLRRLKSETHRVLIFTQMTRMLDILEQFLNYHGHIYLRLDGTTRVEQRQALMERFNADKRIFCFILSTRSGGIGVNLTGADTVIFYDSDWNPTMDAQAQDRCHRIGQTRDVNIYRLVSQRTVEENILKKANQKRLLGQVAIEGGNFTTAFFRTNTIIELFDVNFEDFGCKEAEIRQIKKEPMTSDVAAINNEAISTAQLEYALAHVEEDSDVQATKTAKAEAAAELAEFDESIPYDGDSRLDEETSKVEEEIGALTSQLTPVERYAMKFLESIQEPFSLEQLKQAEEEIEAQKKDWELGRLQALKEEEQRRANLEDDDVPFTYSREDANNQVYVSCNGQEQMPIWAPPTPPQDENDVYIDYCMCFMYEPSLMAESQLPPVYIKRENKRLRVDSAVTARKQKVRKDETVCVPRSLFDRPSAAVLKMRRDLKLQKLRGVARLQVVSGYKLPTVLNKPCVDAHPDSPEWLIHEDWALLQAVQTLLELPLNLTVLSPAHTPNWDMVAEVVNATGHIYRSPKQCKMRYESVIVPREEGKILYDANPKKQKKSKGIYRQTKNNRPMRTCQLFAQDNNASFVQLHHHRFETIKSVANKRTPTCKPVLQNPSMKNPKHAAVLVDLNINYDQPLTPSQVALIRSDRIAREKQKSMAAASTEQQQQLAAQRQQQQQQQALAAQVAVNNPQAVVAQQFQSMINVGGTPALMSTSAIQRNAAGLSVRSLASGGTQQMVSLTAAQVHATQRGLSPATAVSGAGMVSSQASIQTPAGTKNLTMHQLQALKQQQQTLFRQQQQRIQQQRLQAQQGVPSTVTAAVAAQAQKISVAVSSPIGSGAGVTAIHVTQAQQRAQMSKQGLKSDLAHLMKQRPQKVPAAAAVATSAHVAQIQVPTQGVTQILTPAQLHQMQQQQQQAGQTPVATLVKTVSTPTALSSASSVTIPISAVSLSLPNVKASAAASPTQQRQMQFHQQLLQRKMQQQQLQQQQTQKAQLAQVQGKSQLSTVQIVQQAAQKQLPATIQQVIKQVGVTAVATQPTTAQVLSHAMLTKSTAAGNLAQPNVLTTVSNLQSQPIAGQTVQARVMPVNQTVTHAVVTASSPTVVQATALKPTIQVVATTSQLSQAQLRTAATTISFDAISRSQPGFSQSVAGNSGIVTTTTPLVTAPGTKLVSSQAAILAQVPVTGIQSAGQPKAVAVRQNNPLHTQQLTTVQMGSSQTITTAPATVVVTAATTATAGTGGTVQPKPTGSNMQQVRTNYTMRLRNLPKQ